MLAEHSVLMQARGSTIFESGARTSAYLTAVSSTLIALTFVGQMSQMGDLFFIVSLIILPTLIFIGAATFIRVLQTSVEDSIAARGMGRIRHYFLELAPEMQPYLILSPNDDMQAQLKAMGRKPSRLQLFMTMAGMVSVINGILVGVMVGLLLIFIDQTVAAAVIIGITVFLVSAAVQTWVQLREWEAVNKAYPALFPTAEG